MKLIFIALSLLTCATYGQTIVDIYKPNLFKQIVGTNDFCSPYKIKFKNDSIGLTILMDVRNYNALENNINIDSLYLLKFENAVWNLKPVKKSTSLFFPEEICQQFNANVGLTTSIKLMCNTLDYKGKYCTVSYFYKNGVGEVWIYYISTEIDTIKKYLNSSNDAAMIFKFK